MRRRHVFAIVSLWVLALASGCANPVLHNHESVSRDTTWIRLGEEGGSFSAERIVGGEHITRYRLLGFEGERYRVTGRGEDLYMSVDPGDSATVLNTDGANSYVVEIIGLDALISIELSAHPVSEYRLLVEKM